MKFGNKVAIIVVSWNGIRFLNDCFTSINNQTYQNLDVYLVDNDSTDGSFAYVSEHFPKIKIIRLDKNYGYGKGNNEGIKKALSDAAVRYIVCLNNDTIVDKEWLGSLVKTAENDKDIGAVSSKAYFHDGKTIQNAGLCFSPALALNKPGSLSMGYGLTDVEAPELSKEIELFACGGVAPLYKRHVLEELLKRDNEIFDEDFFYGEEDLDIGFRVRSLGYKSILSPRATLIHLHSQTGGAASPLKAYNCERNSIAVAVKNLPLVDLLLFPFRNFLLKLSLLSKKNDSVEKLKKKIGLPRIFWMVIRANLVALFLMPKFLKKRWRI